MVYQAKVITMNGQHNNNTCALGFGIELSEKGSVHIRPARLIHKGSWIPPKSNPDYGGVRRRLGLMDFSSNKFGEISSHTLLQNFPIGITHPICAPNCMAALA